MLPPGFIQDGNTVAYEIHTTATYVTVPDSSSIKLSFQFASFANVSVFNRLGVIHYTPGDPCHPQVLTTARDFATRTLATSTTSLSPFVITPTTDTTAPVTSPVLSQNPNANGWHHADVAVTLTAADEQVGTGVREITYGASGAQVIGETTSAGASASLTISAEGTTQITFRATDLAGNFETVQTLTVRLDKTAPAVNISTPPNGATYTINQSVGASVHLCRLAFGRRILRGYSGKRRRVGHRECGQQEFYRQRLRPGRKYDEPDQPLQRNNAAQTRPNASSSSPRALAAWKYIR